MIAPAILLALTLQAPGGTAPYWQQRLEYALRAADDELMPRTERQLA